MISCITPSIRPGGLDIVKKCLDRQTLREFEWIVVTPYEYQYAIRILEPVKREGDNYSLNRCWNLAFKQAKGELIVSIVDLLWFPPDTLEKFYFHYQANPKACVCGIGHQYKEVIDGRPEVLVWTNPLFKKDKMYYEISPNDFELCLSSIPKQAIFDVGGVDEEFDKYAALSEKELCIRIFKLGYNFYMDQSIEYRAVKHERLTKDWDEKYSKGIPYFQKCIKEIEDGTRLKLTYL